MQRRFILPALVLGLSLISTAAGAPAPGAKADAKKDPETKIKTAMGKLSEADRKLAEAQRYCATQPETRLGSMGAPVKLEIDGKSVFICCESCREEALADAKATLKQVEKLKKISLALGKLKAADLALAEQQRFCGVLEENRLGSMGPPVRIEIQGKPVFLCCEGCREATLADPDATLEKAQKLKTPPKIEEDK